MQGHGGPSQREHELQAARVASCSCCLPVEHKPTEQCTVPVDREAHPFSVNMSCRSREVASCSCSRLRRPAIHDVSSSGTLAWMDSSVTPVDDAGE